MKKALAYALLVTSVLVMFTLPWWMGLLGHDDFYGLEVERPAPDFHLQDRMNSERSLADWRGQYVYLFFGYSNCDRVCHMQVANMLALKQLIGDPGLGFIFITLDPQRDDASVLSRYFDAYGEQFVGLRPASTTAALALAGSYGAFGSQGAVNAQGEYDFDHAGFIYLIDGEGLIRLVYTSESLNISRMITDYYRLIGSRKERQP